VLLAKEGPTQSSPVKPSQTKSNQGPTSTPNPTQTMTTQLLTNYHLTYLTYVTHLTLRHPVASDEKSD
jgi:hypothetical protein